MPNKPRIGLGLGLAGRTGFVDPPLFDPLTYSPYLWNRAEDVTLSGSDIVAFDDLAGNGNYLHQPIVVGARPTQVNGIPGLNPDILGAKFDGVNNAVISFADLGMQVEEEWEIYVLSKFNSLEANHFNIGQTNGGRWYRQSNKDKVRTKTAIATFEINVLDTAFSDSCVLQKTSIFDLNVPVLYAGYEHTHNGSFPPTSVEVSDGFFNGFTGSLVFGQAGVVAQEFDGWLIEVMIFKKHLTQVEEANLYLNYFKRKYGV